MQQFVADANELATGEKYEGLLDAQEEVPAEEEKPAEEEASVDLSAQAQFAALDKEPVKATKTNKKLEEMRLRGYKI